MPNGLLALIGRIGVSHFGNSGGIRAAVRARRINQRILNVVLRVQCDGDDLLLPQAVINLEVIPSPADQTRAHNLRLINVLVVIVVLDQSDGFLEVRSGNENCSQPMMDDRAGRLDPVAGDIKRLKLLHEDLAALE